MPDIDQATQTELEAAAFRRLVAHLRERTDVQNIVNDQSWFVWLPTRVAKLPLSNRFGNLQPSAIPHRLLWNIDRVYVKARAGQ